MIEANSQKVLINDCFSFLLDAHESFVKLECINRILELGYSFKDICLKNDSLFIFNGYSIVFVVWDDYFETGNILSKTALYKSRLVSGVLEYKTIIKDNNELFEYGLFEKKGISLRKAVLGNYHDSDFVIEENRVMHYLGHKKVVVVPEGIEELESSSFWDNQFIEEVVLPNSLKNMGGDTFYNCKNLRKINIPRNVNLMGNNPVAGCPLVEITNESPHFIHENGALYTRDKETMIYCSIKGNDDTFIVPETVIVICKHTFFLCDRLKRVVLPKSLLKMENNPFSGCSQLDIENHSDA